ncbi:hypothetical protein BCEP27_30807 [Burkholderia cepacia]
MKKRTRQSHPTGFDAKVLHLQRPRQADAGRSGATVRRAAEPAHAMDATAQKRVGDMFQVTGTQSSERSTDLTAPHAGMAPLDTRKRSSDSARHRASEAG